MKPVSELDGRYSIERQLGRGAMGTVYLARDNALGRTVAIKLLGANLGEISTVR